ncbi:MAG: hypothetical protein HUJ99_05635 [Bacteroidaceae bacterium]|nr:hypothetical protein [Bacteroidaceae bacterium]
MKKMFLPLTIIALMASCSKSEEVSEEMDLQKGQEIEMTVDFADETRSLTKYENEQFTTYLQKGDLIGVHLLYGTVGESPVYDPMNVKYKVSEKGRLISLGKPITFPKEEGYTLVAYFPYKDNYDPAYEKKFFTVNTDQSTKEDFELSQFMNFSQELTPDTPSSIPLKFQSRVAMASVELEEGQFNKPVANVYIHAYPTGGMAFVNGRPQFLTQGEKAAIKMHKMEENLYAAFVPAQSVVAGQVLYSIEYNDGSTENIFCPANGILMEVAEVSELLIGKNHNAVAKGKK